MSLLILVERGQLSSTVWSQRLLDAQTTRAELTALRAASCTLVDDLVNKLVLLRKEASLSPTAAVGVRLKQYCDQLIAQVEENLEQQAAAMIVLEVRPWSALT